MTHGPKTAKSRMWDIIYDLFLQQVSGMKKMLGSVLHEKMAWRYTNQM